MNSFYVVSNGDEYSFGITDLPFESFSVGKIVHLFLPCYNDQEVLEELSKINDGSGNEASKIIKSDLKRVLKLCIKKIQHIEPEPQDVSNNIILVNSNNIILVNSNNIIIDGSGSSLGPEPVVTEQDTAQVTAQVAAPATPKDDRMKMFENLSLKIFAETENVNQILNKVQSFKSNVNKINQTLDSLRRFKAVTGLTQIPSAVQSERPRGPAPVPQATPRGGVDVLTLEECKIWMKNKSVNPRTGRTIDVNGPTYKRIQAMARMYRLI